MGREGEEEGEREGRKRSVRLDDRDIALSALHYPSRIYTHRPRKHGRRQRLLWSVGVETTRWNIQPPPHSPALLNKPFHTQTYIVKAANGLMLTEELGRRLGLHDLRLVFGGHGRCVMSVEEEEEEAARRGGREVERRGKAKVCQFNCEQLLGNPPGCAWEEEGEVMRVSVGVKAFDSQCKAGKNQKGRQM